MQQYQAVWIPDFADPNNNLSGSLSHPTDVSLPKSLHYIGILSRFTPPKHPNQTALLYDILILLSGAEPQRSYFEELILQQIQNIKNKKMVLVRGVTATHNKQQINPNLLIIDHLTATELQQTIEQSGVIVARSGYSTLMDLATLGKAAIFVPTPQQTEQEYLANRLMQQKHYFSMPQNQFDLNEALKIYEQYTPIKIETNKLLLESIAENFIKNI